MCSLYSDPHFLCPQDNLTLINLMLRLTGPLHERTATNALLLLQAACCAAGLWLRLRLEQSVWDLLPAGEVGAGAPSIE